MDGLQKATKYLRMVSFQRKIRIWQLNTFAEDLYSHAVKCLL